MSKKALTIENRRSDWWATALPFMLGPLDGYSIFPVLIFLFHIRLWTAAVLVVFLVLLVFMNRRGYNLALLARIVVTGIGGRTVSRMPKMGNHRIWR